MTKRGKSVRLSVSKNTQRHGREEVAILNPYRERPDGERRMEVGSVNTSQSRTPKAKNRDMSGKMQVGCDAGARYAQGCRCSL